MVNKPYDNENLCLVLLNAMPRFHEYPDFQNASLGLHVACFVIVEFLVVALLLNFFLAADSEVILNL